ncbi:MAG: NAD+ synthase [Ignavibacteria bacterium]|nr:NAD+ synthase [Ignavibacteria bacterium]
MDLDYNVIEKKIVEFIRKEISRIGVQNAVVGLSGGVDSAVAATLTVKALGGKNVFCISLPYKTSSQHSKDDAKELASILNCNFEIIDISPMVDAYIDNYADDKISNVRKGNIMARMRMIVLYDKSAEYNAVVVGTGNKTEYILGYTTMYGDNACAFNPIGDLYKTQIWEFAKYLNIPDKIINKKPSADLWQGQTDEGEMGFTYLEVDKYLIEKFDKNKSKEELINMGFSIDFIERVDSMIIRNEFKRKLPPIAKLN